MSDDPVLLRAIRDDPNDDSLRLVYADYLEEHGEPERADFIRVQIDLSRLPVGDPRRAALEERERALLQEHEEEWVGPLRLPVGNWGFDRGMLDVVVTVPEFLAHAAALSQSPSAPLLYVMDHAVGTDGIRPLAASPFLARVTALNLAGWYTHDPEESLVDDEQAALLASSPYVTGLRSLNLRCNAVGDIGLRSLASSHSLSGLRELDLRANRFGNNGLFDLASSPRLPEVTALDLGYNDGAVSDAGWRGLARSPYLARLRWLYLGGNTISDVSRQALLGRFGDCVHF
jgi:uncharacterized protein (TIGR02996 family)